MSTLVEPRRSGRRITRTDVAREAGTSVAVVSYVVNDGPRPVAAATRQRVLDAIARTGYRPDSIARALAAGSTLSYGLVVPSIANPFFAELAHAVEDRLFAAGRVLLLGDSAESKQRETELIASLHEHRVEGLLVVGVDDRPEVADLVADATPVVALDRLPSPGRTAAVSIDNRAAARAAVEHLIGHGHRTVGILAGPAGLSTAVEREQGWRDALSAAGLAEAPVARAGFDKRGGYETALRLLAGPERPTALFVSSDQQAIGVLRAAHELGVAVPEQLAVVTFDGTQDTRYSVPALSTVVQPTSELAEVAVRLLLDRDGFAPVHRRLAFSLELRRSCGCAAVPDPEEPR
ncbi:MAG: LacI family DNA-binding transcriptional regulator [Microbacteriaceae bacterium]